MAFEIIKAETRAASLMGWLRGICKAVTDLLPGSVTRSKIEALAVEMELQDFEFYSAVKKAIPTSVYYGFDFTLLPPVNASGTVTFSAGSPAAAPILIPANTQIMTASTPPNSPVAYETLADAIIGIGETTVAANIACMETGSAGNAAAGTITQLKSPISGIASVTNPYALMNGSNQETESARKLRFIEYVSTLTRGTGNAQIYGAKTVALYDGSGAISEQVISAVVDGPPASGAAGSFTLYIFNGADGASAELIAAVQKVIDGDSSVIPAIPGYKAAGIVATVAAADTTAVDVVVAVTALSGVDKVALKAAVESVIDGYITNFDIGQDFVYNELIERIMALEGVYNCDLSSPAADVAVDNTHVIIPGDPPAVTVT